MTGPMTGHRLRWSHGEALVLPTAAMLADCRFDLPGGSFAPFARAPWMGTVSDPSILGHLRELGGDFVCQPFGRDRSLPGAPPGWAEILTHDGQGPIHGPAGDADWDVAHTSETEIVLTLDYPAPSPVRRLIRRIAARQGAAALDLTLTVEARRAARVSLGLHPILHLPDLPGRLELSADFAFGLVHPSLVAPGASQEFATLAEVPGPAGPLNMSQVPLAPRRDINVQLCGMKGPMVARFADEGAGLEIDWDRTLLPSLQIWHTDGGIGGAPWHNLYRGIGLEPVCAAFDLGDAAAVADNPIARRGVPTALSIDTARPVIVQSSFRAFAL